jgi:hypothetical protein
MLRTRKVKYALMATTLLMLGLMISGCAAYAVAPVSGMLYTDVKAGMGATSNSGSSKMGSAECASILGLFATGDASIETAMKNGGITKIHHIDYHSTGILGLYAKHIVTVYGE